MTKRRLERILNNYEWDFGNKILYDLCFNYPLHVVKSEILAKILFIGRIYAVAIERRKNRADGETNEDFYLKKVVPRIKRSRIDQKLSDLNDLLRADDDNFIVLLKTHKYLLELFNTLTELNKHSLSSKYLHFHKPDLFFIYDSRAITALRKCLPRYRLPRNKLQIINSNKVDNEYSKFFVKSMELRLRIENKLRRQITLREYDKILIYYSNKNNTILN
jgi:hypothetical protein